MLNNKFLVLLAASAACAAAVAEPPAAEQYVYRAVQRGELTTIALGAYGDSGEHTASIPAVALNPDNPYGMLAQFGSLLPGGGSLGPHDSLELFSLREDAGGVTQAVYRQFRRGIRVLDAEIRASTMPGHSTQVGQMHWSLNLAAEKDTHTQSAPDGLISAFFSGATLNSHTPPEPVFFVTDGGELVPAWHTEVSWIHPNGSPQYHEVVLRDSDGSWLVFSSLTRNALNRNIEKWEEPAIARHDNASGASDPPTGNDQVDTLFDHFHTVYQSALAEFGLDSVDGHGLMLVGRTDCVWGEGNEANAGVVYENIIHGATYSPEWFCFGPGHNSFWPWDTAPDTHPFALDRDIVAHEYMHAVMRHNGNFRHGDPTYDLAVGEAIADLFGVHVSLEYGSSRPWDIGELVLSAESEQSALRYLGHPVDNFASAGVDYALPLQNVPSTGIACTSSVDDSLTPSSDQDGNTKTNVWSSAWGDVQVTCDPHANSGSVSLAAHLLAHGGLHPRFPSLRVEPVGNHVVSLFLRAAREAPQAPGVKWRMGGFKDFKEQTVRAFEAEYGILSPQVISLCTAWHAVGVPAFWWTANARDSGCDELIPPVPTNVEVDGENGINAISWAPPPATTILPEMAVSKYKVRVSSSPRAHGNLAYEGPSTSFLYSFSGEDQYVRVQACSAHACGPLTYDVIAKGTVLPTSPAGGTGRVIAN